ncbi:MAG TPA: hypothetical protein VKR56_06185 [Candidatus Cybelea sp.]|nr:hypothetical protein [Candidatus Cybelea sp.]
MTARKIVLIFAFGLLGIGALRDFARLGDALPWHRLYDFQDFYCAGEAVDQHADPYRYDPLHRCEHRVNQSEAYRRDPNRIVPAPIPPYDLPPFELAARLGFPAARTIDAIAIVLAVAVAIAGLAAIGIPLDLVAAALVLPAGYLLLDAGQIVPFALAALVFCGVALAQRRDAIAGVLAALTLIEPHLGLPVWISVLLLVPRSRAAAVVTGLLMALAGVLIVGPAGAIEYLSRVLPAQAASETGYPYQYSLTYLLVTAGLPQGVALAAGQLSYAGLLAVGISLGRRLATALHRRELVAYLPAACSVAGGAYVHMVDIAIAVPAALVLATYSRAASRTIATLALCLLAVPWIDVWITKKLFLSSLFVVAAILVRQGLAPAISVGAFTAIAVAIYCFELRPPAPFSALTAIAARPGDLAQQAWRAYVVALRTAPMPWLAIKLPTWAALCGLLVAGFQTLLRPSAKPPT